MADETAVLLNISEMIDLAIGTPEVGVVDFCMLQTVLHCLAQQMRVLGKNVELRGSVAALPVGRENSQTIAVSEFVVDTDQETQMRTIQKIEMAPPQPSSSEQETILVVERVKRADSPVNRSPPRAQSPPPTAPSPVPVRVSSTEKLSLVTLSKFNLLENTVEDLKNRVYGSIPKNEEILEEVRSQTNLKAITDMWTSLNVSSRLEAAEVGIAKLSSLVQDIISDTAGLQEAIAARRASKPAEPVITTIVAPPVDNVASKDDLASIQQHLTRIRNDLDNLTNAYYTAMAEIQAGLDAVPPSPPPPVPPTIEIPVRKVSEQPRRSFSMLTAGLMERMNDLEKRLKECCDNLGKKDGAIQDQINSFQDQIEYLTRQVAALAQNQNTNAVSPDLFKDIQGLMALFQTVQEMQQQLKLVHETALQLAAEKEDRLYHMNALLEQIELLKTIKLDREDMVEAMAEKADLRMLARKVSHDQFEMACDDLSRGLEHALGKLTLQESLWQQALDDIQREIETKLDKMELSPVKEFFNNKLRQLQENLKEMAALRREAEAAGTKRKLLRDVNCISCDARAVMPMEAASNVPVIKPMPANLSMKPYLTYELDAIRKTQATNVPQRNMRDWENIEKQMGQMKPPAAPPKTKGEGERHLCNRYCGGSHTTTTAAQRVARLGHFMKQWGPDVLPLSSGLAAGDDGRMYKVSAMEGANVGPGGAVDATCTPRFKKTDLPPKPPPKPLLVTPECHCLEADRSTKG